jgi:DNA-binding NtrC family response regulator
MSPWVLVVEDYADLRRTITEALERHEYSCASASSSEAAVVMLEDHDYEAILISPKLPVSDDPVVHYLMENRPADMSKVIVMSDPSTPTGPCRALLEKPFTNQQLLQIVERKR